MPQVHVHLPQGYSSETKKEFLSGFKTVLSEAFNVPTKMSSLMMTDFNEGNFCKDGKRTMFIMISTTLGKPDEQKAKCVKGVHDLCMKYFGDIISGTDIILDEHDTRNICQDGICRYPGMKLY